MFHIKTNIDAIVVPKVPKLDNVPITIVVVVTTHIQMLEQQIFREHEPVKAKTTIDWQTKEQMCDSFVHTIKDLHAGDSKSQAPIDLNGMFHSNWVGLSKITNQLVMGKQLVHLIVQIMTRKKTLEDILKDINIQVLKTNYIINLGQILRIVLDIK
jgi:hypothetical protein